MAHGDTSGSAGQLLWLTAGLEAQRRAGEGGLPAGADTKGPVLQRQKWHRCPRRAGLGPSLSATRAGEILRGFFLVFFASRY